MKTKMSIYLVSGTNAPRKGEEVRGASSSFDHLIFGQPSVLELVTWVLTFLTGFCKCNRMATRVQSAQPLDPSCFLIVRLYMP